MKNWALLFILTKNWALLFNFLCKVSLHFQKPLKKIENMSESLSLQYNEYVPTRIGPEIFGALLAVTKGTRPEPHRLEPSTKINFFQIRKAVGCSSWSSQLKKLGGSCRKMTKHEIEPSPVLNSETSWDEMFLSIYAIFEGVIFEVLSFVTKPSSTLSPVSSPSYSKIIVHISFISQKHKSKLTTAIIIYQRLYIYHY